MFNYNMNQEINIDETLKALQQIEDIIAKTHNNTDDNAQIREHIQSLRNILIWLYDHYKELCISQ